jgi:heparan-alpha-glucosaminide N-acetyltransferase
MITQNSRIPSIDLFRALTMLLMIFVNDLGTLKGIPSWLEHAPTHTDFLGLADVVFPCFLIIMGMSIPLAINGRLAKGQSKGTILRHIIERSLALIVMGVFTVNSPELNEQTTGLTQSWYTILMVVGFFLIWNKYPSATGWKKNLFWALKAVGIVLLVWLAFIYRGSEYHSDELVRFMPRWWGVLNLCRYLSLCHTNSMDTSGLVDILYPV